MVTSYKILGNGSFPIEVDRRLRMNRLIIVEGLPCSGKSTTSKYIADRIGAVFYDEGSGDHPTDYEFHAFIENR